MKLNNFIICDLVRQENTNKVLLVGIYDDNITFLAQKENPTPLLLPLSFFVRFRKSQENEEVPVGFEFIAKFDLKDQPPIKLSGPLKAEPGKGITILLAISPMMIHPNTKKIGFEVYLKYADGHSDFFPLDEIKVGFAMPNVSALEPKK
jgi:hypothetical protein